MFATPAAIVAARPTFGRSAAMKKLWNMFCMMENGSAASKMKPYASPWSLSVP